MPGGEDGARMNVILNGEVLEEVDKFNTMPPWARAPSRDLKSPWRCD